MDLRHHAQHAVEVVVGHRPRQQAVGGRRLRPAPEGRDRLQVDVDAGRAGGDPARSMLIGDTVTDRDTARAAGVPIVLVSFGPDGDGVSALDPDALLPEYAALPGLVSELLPLH